ncbi:MAG TPA: protein phosphatase 2C domain-containing protein [Kofleriaceae bacterium]|jgi:hypothetical protein
MNTKSLRVSSAAVTGARHLRDARNGQDAAVSAVVALPLGKRAVDVVGSGSRSAAVVVVCDGCGSGASSEVGARLGARAVLGAITRRLAGQRAELHSKLDAMRLDVTSLDVTSLDATTLGVTTLDVTSLDENFWRAVRADVVAFLGDIARRLPGQLEDVVHDYLLFTIVAAVVIDETAYVWAIGDGAYAIDGMVRELGPFANNQPPYIAYDLIGTPAVAHTATARVRASVLVATDGSAEMRTRDELSIARMSRDPAAFVSNPDALRRFLTKQAKSEERIDWTAQRVIRTPAALQDDGAIGLIVRDDADERGDADERNDADAQRLS